MAIGNASYDKKIKGEYQIFSKKSLFHNINDIEQNICVDLISKSVESGLYSVFPTDFIIVDERMEMRPDLISIVAVGSEDKADIIAKYNGISNLFSIKKGDIILIPNFTDASNFINVMDTSAQQRVKDQLRNDIKKALNAPEKEPNNKATIDNLKHLYDGISGTTPNLNSFRQQANKGTNVSKDLLPPNFSDDAKKEITVKPNGEVSLGTNVAKNRADCDIPLTKTELLNNLIKNRIKKR